MSDKRYMSMNSFNNMQQTNYKELSSCDCYNCSDNLYINQKRYSNNCDFNPYFECKNRLKFKEQIEPLNDKGYTFLNPESVSKAYAPDFYKIDCSDVPQGYAYTSTDPRLISIMHNGQVLPLDRPPTDESIKLKDIYTDPKMNYYGKRYNEYQDINVGQILYYIDKSIEDDLFQPVFENPSEVQGTIYKDPMGATYPEYARTPIKNNNVLKTKNRTYTYGLSSIDDINEFREDIIHKQMRVNDRSRYSSRYSGNIVY
jgi:hypothetical protein